MRDLPGEEVAEMAFWAEEPVMAAGSWPGQERRDSDESLGERGGEEPECRVVEDFEVSSRKPGKEQRGTW